MIVGNATINSDSLQDAEVRDNRLAWMLDVTTAGEQIASGTLTPSVLVESVLGRIAEVDDTVSAYIHVMETSARAEAAVATRDIAKGRWRGPLHGIPFAVKDTFDIRGIPTTASSAASPTAPAADDCALVARLRAAGAIPIGKLSTWEFGTGNGGAYFDLPFPPARNPWDTERFAGGSSTGAGAAVTAGMALFALGSDTTGSIRLPAGATGTLGLVPTQGALPLEGILPNCFSLDRPGPICRTARDAALILATLADTPDLARQVHRPVSRMRVGVVRDPGSGMAAPDASMARAFETALDCYHTLGVDLVDISLPVPVAECLALTQIIGAAETAAIHEADLADHSDKLGRALRDKLLAGSVVRAVDYIQALRRRTEIAAALDAMMVQFDAVVTFGALHLPPRLGVEPEMTAFTLDTMLTPFNLSGHPMLVHCTGFTNSGLPTHLQIVGNYKDEAAILRLAHAFGRETLWYDRWPDIPPTAPAPPPVPNPSLQTPTMEFRARADRMGLGALNDGNLHRMESLENIVGERGVGLRRPALKSVRPGDPGNKPS